MKLLLNTDKIERELKRLGMTKTNLAELMGISKQKLHYILKEKPIKHAHKFGEVFDVSGKDFIL